MRDKNEKIIDDAIDEICEIFEDEEFLLDKMLLIEKEIERLREIEFRYKGLCE